MRSSIQYLDQATLAPHSKTTQSLNSSLSVAQRSVQPPYRLRRLAHSSARSLTIDPEQPATNRSFTAESTETRAFGDTLSAAFNIGNVNGTTFTINDAIGSADPNDYFRFSLSGSTTLSLSLAGLTADADLQLLNSSGGVIAGSYQSGSTAEAITSTLGTGTYYMRVFPYLSASTNYTLTLRSSGATPDPGSTTSTALDLGNLTNGSRTRNEFVSTTTDPNDYYRFELASNSNFNLSLNNLSADADVQLLSSSGSVLASSVNFGTTPDTISRSLGIGTYFVRVYPYGSSVSYRLNLSATPTSTPTPTDPGNTLSTARVQSSSVFSQAQQVSSGDRDDFYRFTVSQSGILTANLTELSGDADVRLIRDANSNGIVDQGEVLSWQWERGTRSESIRRFVGAGTYFLQVASYNNQTANYRVATNFAAATSDSRQFTLRVNFGANLGGLTTAARNAITRAAQFWQNIISHSSFSGAHTLTVDVFGVTSSENFLAYAGPRSGSTDASNRWMPITGESGINTRFNSTYNSNPGFLESVMVHEFGHVLGIGTLWENLGRSLINRTTVTYNAATYAGWAYGELLRTFRQTSVPVEARIFGHWDEGRFNQELMTPVAETPGTAMPLSQLTIASLRDIGWNVNYGAAQSYTLPTALTAPSTSSVSTASLFQASSDALTAPSTSSVSTASLFQASSDLNIRCGCSLHLAASGLNFTGTTRLTDAISAHRSQTRSRQQKTA